MRVSRSDIEPVVSSVRDAAASSASASSDSTENARSPPGRSSLRASVHQLVQLPEVDEYVRGNHDVVRRFPLAPHHRQQVQLVETMV